MLKITFSETATGESWFLQGRLVGPWVSELEACWHRNHRTEKGRTCVVDLNDLTWIDKSGERILRTMSRQGAEFIANGLYIKYLLEKLRNKPREGE